MPLSRQALLICLLLPLLGQQALLLRALSLAFGLLPLLFGLLKELPQVLFLFYLVLLAGLNKNSLLDADRLRSLRQPRRFSPIRATPPVSALARCETCDLPPATRAAVASL